MNSLHLAFLAMIFLAVVFAIMFVYNVWSESRFPQRRKIKKRLMYMAAGGGHGREKLNLYKKSVLKNLGFFDRLAFAAPRIAFLDRMLVRARFPYSASAFIIISICLAGLGIMLGGVFSSNAVVASSFGLLLFIFPYTFLKLREKDYFAKFEEQLPEALDLLARSLKVGHALSSGIEMVAKEMDDPIKSEFAAAAVDINIGLSVKETFDNLCERVPSRDLRFFAIAVLIQRETGGSLSKILDDLSKLIRQRIQFKRRVKALTAEGRISSVILTVLPILLFVYLYIINYDYISLLWTSKTGLIMLCTAIVLQIAGMVIMKKMVTIDM
jgi:tight adherence protein B